MNRRSMTAEIVSILQDHFSVASSHLPPELAERIEAGESPVKVWREFRGLDRKQLAALTRTPDHVLYSVENGQRSGSLSVMQRIATTLGITVDDLI